ncbi:MAG: heavy metal-binding domain-containing protein [Verrucomicrobiota bacterium]
MKFIARHLNLIGLLLLASFASAAAALYFQVPERIQTARAATAAPAARYACPMHPKITSATPADCSECGMKLVALAGDKPAATAAHKSGCCAEKPVAAELPPAATCPHLAAQAAQATHADSCCPKPANP